MAGVLRLHMSRGRFLRRLRDLPGTLTGRVPDNTGIVPAIMMAGAIAVLTRLYEHTMRLAKGGIGDDGIRWKPLKPSTLILRRKVTTKSAISRLVSEIRKEGPARRRLFLKQLKSARKVFTEPRQRRIALRILGKMKGSSKSRQTMSDKRYKELYRLLTMKPPKPVRRPKKTTPAAHKLYDHLDEVRRRKYEKRLKVITFAAAGALILIDTMRMVGAFSPGYSGPDQKREVGPGGFTIDNNVEQFKFHQSDEPRKLGKDGNPILPRRNCIPDVTPDSWIEDAMEAMVAVLAGTDTMKRYFEGAA